MGTVKAEMSMSLDGFIAGPDDDIEQPLGAGGERLHQWLYDLPSFHAQHHVDPRTGKPFSTARETNQDDEVYAESFRNVGAVVMGNRMFIGGERLWGENPPFHMPVFVLAHQARAPLAKEGGTTFFFITDGLESVVKQAKAAAGDKDVLVTGGANIIQQLINAGLLDELQIHLVPVLFGSGRRLFEHGATRHIELEQTRVIASPGVTHLRFRLPKKP